MVQTFRTSVARPCTPVPFDLSHKRGFAMPPKVCVYEMLAGMYPAAFGPPPPDAAVIWTKEQAENVREVCQAAKSHRKFLNQAIKFARKVFHVTSPQITMHKCTYARMIARCTSACSIAGLGFE